MSIDMSGLGDLSMTEKLRLVTALWDDIASSSEPIVVPEDILEEASRRTAEIAQDPSIAIDDAEVWRRVDG
jgi:putative addiction module component (TIGR02574 family)